MKGRKMLSNSEVAVFCEQSGMILSRDYQCLKAFLLWKRMWSRTIQNIKNV